MSDEPRPPAKDSDPDQDMGGFGRYVDSGRELIPELAPAVAAMVRSTGRFSKEFVATMIALASAAFGLIAALAWNTAITKWLSIWLKTDRREASGYFVYAVIVTLIGVVVIVMLGRLATRINAQPIEFKYPGSPKT